MDSCVLCGLRLESCVVYASLLPLLKRPLWPVAVMMAPIVVGMVWCPFLLMAYIYFLLMCIGIIIFMVRALRQYGRWLRDNYLCP